jgi:hypothetical protein
MGSKMVKMQKREELRQKRHNRSRKDRHERGKNIVFGKEGNKYRFRTKIRIDLWKYISSVGYV